MRSILAVMMGALLSFGPGCGSGPPRPADPVAAREALEVALAAWQAGRPPESLQDRQPRIDVSDHQWSQGVHLASHQIEDRDRASGADHLFHVALWLETGRKKPEEVHTEYFVGTSPTLRIIRSGL
jgi:hypothetical protein